MDAADGYTKTLKVYWKPENRIDSASYKINNSSGTSVMGDQIVINDSNLTGIYVQWTYSTDVPKAGFVEGYRVRVYKSGASAPYYDTLITNMNTKNIIIPKLMIPKGVATQISITPYYTCGLTNTDANKENFVYATESRLRFVKLISKLEKPVIKYPVNNTTWINKYIRIALQLPRDADADIQGDNYRYEDIELTIDDTYTIHFKQGSSGATTSGTNVVSTDCFSTTTLEHMKKIVIQPSLSAQTAPLSDGVHKFKIRVKKQYNTDASFNGWSDWSDTVTVTFKTYSYTVNEGDKILAAHYNTIHDYVTSIATTYGVTAPPIGIRAVQNETIISQAQYTYSRMFKPIQDVMILIRDYCTYDNDKTALKFNNGNNIVTSFPTYEEYVTAVKTKSGWTSANPNGRNYMKHIFDYGSKLQ